MKELLTRDIEIFGKAVPAFLVAILIFAGTTSAALLASFGQAQGTATVTQAVTVNGQEFESGTPECQKSYTVAGGDLGEFSCTVQNNADDLVEVALNTSTSAVDTDGNWMNSDGADTTHIMYEQWAVGDQSKDVTVSASEDHVTEGDYSLHFESESDNNDYAIVWYDTSDIAMSPGELVTYDGEAYGDNPLNDEVWILTEDGEQFWYHGGETVSNGAEFELQDSNFNNVENSSETYEGDFSDVVAVGVGQGAPQSGISSVDTYIDNVQVSGESVDEPEDPSLHLKPTGAANGVKSHYRMNAVTDFAVNAQAGDHTVETSVEPAQ